MTDNCPSLSDTKTETYDECDTLQQRRIIKALYLENEELRTQVGELQAQLNDLRAGITFSDQSGKPRFIEYYPGILDLYIKPGWGIPEDADWQAVDIPPLKGEEE